MNQTKGKILVVDDEKDLLSLIKYNLETEGYSVQTAKNAENALQCECSYKPDLMIVDIMLPGMDGLEFCGTIRKKSQVPIIFLTAKKSEIDKVLGLKLGADDYITKPFSIKELLARVHAILRRTHNRTPSKKENEYSSFGAIEINFNSHEVRVRKKFINLCPKEFSLLRLLVQAKGNVLSRTELLERVWGVEKSSEIYTRTVDQHIARLRKKLHPEEKRIQTVSNFGYKIKTN